jgi:hypothetical protein
MSFLLLLFNDLSYLPSSLKQFGSPLFNILYIILIFITTSISEIYRILNKANTIKCRPLHNNPLHQLFLFSTLIFKHFINFLIF